MHPFPRSATPPPFLRRPSSTSSSSFLSSTTSISEESSDESTSDSDSEDDDETEGYYSSSGLSGDEARFIRRLDLSASGGAGGGPPGPARFPAGASAAGGPRSGATSARSNLKLSLAVLRARHALKAQAYDALASALKSLAAALPPLSSLVSSGTSGNALGVFVPLLARLAKDVRDALVGDERGREFRRTKLSREDAKALVALKQRWTAASRGDGTKGKGKEVETDWVTVVEDVVAKNPPPPFFADEPYIPLTAHLLTSLESFLLPSSLPRLSLSDLNLHDRDLTAWPALRRLEEVVAWYLSFAGPSEDAQGRARRTLEGVKSLDLSKNKLTTFPLYLARLFPQLETLSLSHNLFPHLPPWITAFSSLRRLRTHGNRLVSSRRALKPLNEKRRREKAYPRRAGTRADARNALAGLREQILWTPPANLLPSSSDALRPLLSISTELTRDLIHSSPADSPDRPLLSSLPSHLQNFVLASYACTSCHYFVFSTSHLYVPPFHERVHHLDPGISIPSRLPPPVPSPHPSHNGLALPSAPTERLATLEQRVLLALLARLDARPPPPPPPPMRRSASSASLSSLASTSTTSNGPPRRRPTRRERDWEAGKAVLPTLVIGGDGPHGDGYRFCALCAAAHLGLDDELRARGVAWECRCVVCVEERRVREGDPVEEDGRPEGEAERSKVKVMRWLRRKERAGREAFPPGATRIV
ncbi:hypothetical protein JCM10207_006933 [Rhodosporidiobolus poonsookiae]